MNRRQFIKSANALAVSFAIPTELQELVQDKMCVGFENKGLKFIGQIHDSLIFEEWSAITKRVYSKTPNIQEVKRLYIKFNDEHYSWGQFNG